MFSLIRLMAALPLLAAATSHASPDRTAQADAIHRQVIELDSHVDVPLPAAPSRYVLADGTTRATLDKLVAGGLDAVVFALAVGPGGRDAPGVAEARAIVDRKLALIRRFVAHSDGRAAFALSADDVERLHREGRIAIIIGFLNARSIGSDLSQLDVLYREGARLFAFTHSGHNDLADSSRPSRQPPTEHGGLSALGRQAIARLNDLGAIIDVSQLSTEALMQAVQLSRAPVVASHSSVRALVDDVRNLSDAELDAIKAKGGVIQLTPYDAYLRAETAESRKRIGEIRVRYGLPAEFVVPTDSDTPLPEDRHEAFLDEIHAARPHATLSDYVDHIDYVVRRLGWQHAGIGSDFNHGGGVTGFDSEAEAPNVTRELVRRGYTREQIAGIWGGNFLRVWRAAEAARKPDRP